MRHDTPLATAFRFAFVGTLLAFIGAMIGPSAIKLFFALAIQIAKMI